MSDLRDDRDLRDAFAAARARDRAAAPAFAEIVSRKRRLPRPMWPTAAVALALAAVVVMGIRLRSRIEPPAPEPAASIVSWRGPTDFLLDLPGSELPGAVPSIGRGFDVDVVGRRVSPRPSERGPS